MLLVRFEMVTIEKLKSFRGYFIVLAFVVAAVLTPPDVVSQLALAIPMCVLYEVGIVAGALLREAQQGARGRAKGADSGAALSGPRDRRQLRRYSGSPGVRRIGVRGLGRRRDVRAPSCRCRAAAQSAPHCRA